MAVLPYQRDYVRRYEGKNITAEFCASVTDFRVCRRRKGLLFFRSAGGRSWAISTFRCAAEFGRFWGGAEIE